MSGRLDAVRASTARVAERARFVRIDEGPLRALAAELSGPARTPAVLDPAHHHLGRDDETLAFVLTLDAINFGSGYFPELAKLPGLSGYFTIATRLKERFDRKGALTSDELRACTPAGCAEIFHQDLSNPAVAELMTLFARALVELGAWIDERYGGRFAGPVEAAGGSAEALVDALCQMSMYRDVAAYEGEEVAFYKRAQLTVCDLHAAFEGKGPGRFVDLDRLTIFADNLVPHVLRCEGVLVYDADLVARIERGELIPVGSPEEVEMRALSVVAVERMVDHLRGRGIVATAQRLDTLLWTRGQAPAIKAHPRHRTRCFFY